MGNVLLHLIENKVGLRRITGDSIRSTPYYLVSL